MTHTHSDDPELDALLARASEPQPPAHGPRAVMAEIERREKVVAFPPRRHIPWTAVAALAASLAIGIYLGASGAADSWLGLDAVAEFDGFGGFDADDAAEGDVS